MTPLLQARGLALTGRLDPTDFDARAGELVCLVGPNGSGKTSLLHALAGIGAPAGEVRIAGEALAGLHPDRRRRLYAYLPAARDILWPLTARDLVALGLPRGMAAEAIDAVLAELGLALFAGRRVDRLSTGERSRVLIARALVARPRLLLLDEPAANLDPYWQLQLMERLRALAAERAVVVAVHDLDLAARYADRLLVMDRGRVAADGEPAALLAGPIIPQVFGIAKVGGLWRPVSRREDPRSSR